MNAVTPRPKQIGAAVAQLAEQAITAGELYDRVDIAFTNRQEFNGGMEALRAVKGLQKELEERRVSVTGPLNAVLDTINSWFRRPKEALQGAERKLKTAGALFERAEAERARKEQAAAEALQREQALELQRRADKAAQQGKADKAEQLLQKAEAVAAAPVPQQVAPVKAKGISFGSIWRPRIVDVALIPREYLIPNEAMIAQVVKASGGKVVIPGVECFEDLGGGVRSRT